MNQSVNPPLKSLRATQRLQFHKDFTLDHATALVPYFARLGISHLYASPLLKARAGSMHRYDVVDQGSSIPSWAENRHCGGWSPRCVSTAWD